MRNGMIGLSLMLCLTAVGCKSSVEASCDKAKECDTLGSQSYDDCVKEGEELYSKLEKDSDCDTIREKLDALTDCSTDLSCDEVKSTDALEKCESQFNAYMDAIKADGAKCDGTNAGN